MATPLRVLIAEDRPADAELMMVELRRAGFDPDWARVDNEKDYLTHLDDSIDLILADHSMPEFDSPRALRLLQERGLDVPLIVVTGSIGEEKAVELIRTGAADYLLKDRLARLGEATRRALAEKKLRDEKRQADAALIARARQQAAVAGLGQRALEDVDLAVLMGEATALVAATLQVEYAKVLELLAGGESLLLRAGVGWKEGYVGHAEVSTGTGSQAGYTLLTGKPVIVEDLGQERRFSAAPLLTEYGVVSGMSVVIRGREQPFGVLGAHAVQRRAFTGDDLNFVEAMGNVLAAAVERRRAEEEIEHRNRELALFNRVITAAASSLNIEEVLTVACRELAFALGLSQAAATLFDEAHKSHTFLASYPEDEQGIIVGTVLLVKDDPLSQWILEHKAPLAITDSQHDPRLTNVRDLVTRRGTRALLLLPLTARSEVIGTIGLEATAPREFGNAEIELASSIAATLSQTLENARLYRELESYSSFLEQAVQERTEELRRSKDHVETILNTVGEAVTVIDPRGRMLQANPAHEQLTGYAAHEVELRHYHELSLDQAMSHEALATVATAIRAGQGWKGEAPVRRKDGTVFDAAVTITPMRNALGDVTAFVSVMRDVSPLKEVARLKDEFVSNVSHELRTPITSLRLTRDLMRRDPSRLDVYMERLRRDIDRLNVLIEDLLRLSRLQQGHTELDLKPFDLNALAAQYVDDRSPLAESRELSLVAESAPDLPSVQADAGLLGQALSVLLTNALNYTPAGGRVTIGTHEREVEGRTWAGFSVSDTGLGIPAEELSQLFTRFFRGSVGRESGASGTGLGLAIAKEIVERHAGRIEISSEGIPGQGAAFYVWLPVKRYLSNDEEEK